MALPSLVTSNVPPGDCNQSGLLHGQSFYQGMMFNSEFERSSLVPPAASNCHQDYCNLSQSSDVPSNSMLSAGDQLELSNISVATQSGYYEYDITSSSNHETLLEHPGSSSSSQQLSLAPSPQSSIELSSLQIEKNRETLKHKLSHRASIRELVCRGIYPCKQAFLRLVKYV